MGDRPEIQPGYPLQFPVDRPRTAARDRKEAMWRDAGRRLSLTVAKKRLSSQVDAMTRVGRPHRVLNHVLSTNIRYTASGSRDQNVSRKDPEDPGVAFYFDLDGKPHVLACDRWDTVADNIAAIAAHIEALRGQERWGVADLRQAFAGHTALPAPEQSRHWTQVLNLPANPTADQINAHYRARAKDAASNGPALLELNLARDAARTAIGAA